MNEEPRMDWSDVRIFLAVCREGSTLAASRVLSISQPTVARRIDALEHALGLTLFDRDTRGFHPTADAERLRSTAVAMETAAKELAETAAAARTSRSSRIRITAPRRNFSPTFSAILSEFSALHPEVRFELISGYEVLDLVKGEADIAIRIARTITDPRLICTRLTDVKSTLFASRGYAERRGLPASEKDFEGHSFVIYDPVPKATPLGTWLLDRIRPEQIVARCVDTESVAASIEAGLGIGPCTIAFAMDYPSLVRCFDPPEGTDVSSWLLVSPEAYRRPEVRAFAAFFAPRFRAAYTKMREQAWIAQTYTPRD